MTWLILLAITASLVALLCLGLAWEIVQILRARVPAFPRILHVGSNVLADDLAPTIPKIIWTYWHESPAPEFIRHCHDNWRHFAPDHVLHVIDKSTITDWLDAQLITDQFAKLPPFRQADWLRLQLLAQHGGIWIDASTLLTQSLDWVHALQAEQGSEFVGFYIDRFTTRQEAPIVENWFMAARPQSPFVVALAQEFGLALHRGESYYLEKLQATGKLEQAVQGLGPKDQLYLIMHVAASVILSHDLLHYRLALLRAEDSALGFHAALKWRKRHLYARLALTPCPKNLPCIIKLRGGERRIFERGWTRNWVLKNSALARLLAARGLGS